MPQEYIKYPDEMQDGRRKLSTIQKEEILNAYNSGSETWNSLAEKYGVNKRTIGFIVNPKTLEKVRARIKKTWKQYYNKEYQTQAMRKLRAKKRALGLIKKREA